MAPDRYFFCHLAKTGGHSLLLSLRKQFGDHAVYPLLEHEGNSQSKWDPRFMVDFMERRGDEIRVIAGHYPLCTRELFDFPLRTFTMLRDPVERTLSHLRYQAVVDPSYEHKSITEAFYDIKDNLANRHKYMVRMLSRPLEDVMSASPIAVADPQEADLERAKQNLADIDVVGVLEHIDVFYRALDSTFGWDLGPPPHSNTTDPTDVPDRILELIRDQCEMDMDLYRFALDLVEKRADIA